MRRLRRAAPDLPDIEHELLHPDPERYRNPLARFIAKWAARNPWPERARSELEMAHDYERGHMRRHPEEYREAER